MNRHLGHIDEGRAAPLQTERCWLALRKPRGVDIDLMAAWLADARINRWLHFGGDRLVLGAPQIKSMLINPQFVLRLICAGEDEERVGVIGFNDVSERHRTASIWIVRTVFRPDHGSRLAERAGTAMLDHGFGRLGLASISGWAVSLNRASLAAARNVGFQIFGVQRACHVIDGRALDRVHFDITREEHLSRPRGDGSRTVVEA